VKAPPALILPDPVTRFDLRVRLGLQDVFGIDLHLGAIAGQPTHSPRILLVVAPFVGARAAGGHIHSDTGDVFYANKSYVSLTAETAGHEKITFPGAVTVYDAFNNVLLQTGKDTYEFDAAKGDVRIFRVIALSS
jgi:hypothetical protein